jgi:hypothetical protein
MAECAVDVDRRQQGRSVRRYMLVYCRTAECVDRQPTLAAALREQVNVENALFDVREQSHNMRRNMQ